MVWALTKVGMFALSAGEISPMEILQSADSIDDALSIAGKVCRAALTIGSVSFCISARCNCLSAQGDISNLTKAKKRLSGDLICIAIALHTTHAMATQLQAGHPAHAAKVYQQPITWTVLAYVTARGVRITRDLCRSIWTSCCALAKAEYTLAEVANGCETNFLHVLVLCFTFNPLYWPRSIYENFQTLRRLEERAQGAPQKPSQDLLRFLINVIAYFGAFGYLDPLVVNLSRELFESGPMVAAVTVWGLVGTMYEYVPVVGADVLQMGWEHIMFLYNISYFVQLITNVAIMAIPLP
jgi:hypothetical protein